MSIVSMNVRMEYELKLKTKELKSKMYLAQTYRLGLYLTQDL